MKTKNSGFTLVEILIVVVILGILAAIVIPQFTNASTEAKEAQLRTDLQTMRSQIGLYKIQHRDGLPSTEEDLTGVTPDGYGPYLRDIPSNPFVDGEDAKKIEFNEGEPTGEGRGWHLNTDTGELRANSPQEEHRQW